MRKFLLLYISVCSLQLLASCDLNVNSNTKSEEELRMDLRFSEENNPLNNLSVENASIKLLERKVKNGGLFRNPKYVSDGALIEGEIVNIATLAIYKDITLNVSFYSKTKSLIDEQKIVVYEFINPSSKIPFSIKIDDLGSEFHSFGIEVSDALPVR